MKLENVPNRYGAPMGRRDSPRLETSVPRFVRLSRVRIGNQGYDNGGAYWGVGVPLFVARDGDGNRQFVRASNRVQAALKLGVGSLALKVADHAEFQHYGMAILDGRAPMPKEETRESICTWMQESGAAMGQPTAYVIGPNRYRSRRYPTHMAAALVGELGEGFEAMA